MGFPDPTILASSAHSLVNNRPQDLSHTKYSFLICFYSTNLSHEFNGAAVPKYPSIAPRTVETTGLCGPREVSFEDVPRLIERHVMAFCAWCLRIGFIATAERQKIPIETSSLD